MYRLPRRPLAVCAVVAITLVWSLLPAVSCDAQVPAGRTRAPRSINETVCALYNSSCGQCISVGCHWCIRADFGANESRCDSRDRAFQKSGIGWCPANQIIASNASTTYHNNTDPRGPTAGRPAIQLSPQNLTVRVRPNFPSSFQVTFRQAENYPVDLYFLMDVSWTMEIFRQTLVEMSDQLTRQLRNITSDYRIGFGSFVDKPTMPFCSRRHLRHRIINNYTQVQPAYSFRHLLNLTTDVVRFRRQVNETQISGNLDRPEGVFDALMQTIACSREIGWRNGSRKLILISTDADFHMAGDGLLGGIIEHNDEKCHLDSFGEYPSTVATSTDYPSISQIARKIVDMKVNVIFAIPTNRTKVSSSYKQLCGHMEGCYVAELSENCDNIVELIRSNYDKISSTVQLKYRLESDRHRSGKTGSDNREQVRVTFRSECLSPDGPEVETSSCHMIGIGESVHFNVSIEVLTVGGLCPANRDRWTKRIVIYPAGLADSLSVEVKLDCQCPCERPEVVETTSPRCGSRGTLQCGACACNAGFSGQRCECPLDENLCREPGFNASSGSGPVCSGRGRCVCGRCECDAVSAVEPSRLFTGRQCECNDFSCEYHNGRLCGGPERGVCLCGKCRCEDGWTGDRCDCSTSTEGCKARRNNRTCNDAGSCVCNECHCDPRSIYRGATCDECPTCSDKCDEYAECVRCKVGKGTNGDCRAAWCPEVRLVLTGAELPRGNETLLESCSARLDKNCLAIFTYDHTKDELTSLKQPVCENPVTIIQIWLIVGLAAGVLALGVVLLSAWKIYVTVHDRREYARFQNECENAKYAMIVNPVYKTAVKTSVNPIALNS